VEAIGSGTRDNLRHERRRAPVLGRKIAIHHAEFLHSLGGCSRDGSRDDGVVVINAVQQVIASGNPLAVHRKRQPPADYGALGRHPRLEKEERIDVTARQR
jgi:hypothetical protein